MPTDEYERRFKKLVRAYMKAYGDSEETCAQRVSESIAEDGIEITEQNVEEGLLSVGAADITKMFRRNK